MIPDAILWHNLPDSLSILGGALIIVASIMMGTREVQSLRYSAVPTIDDIEMRSLQSLEVQES
jgi:hypothetical protein